MSAAAASASEMRGGGSMPLLIELSARWTGIELSARWVDLADASVCRELWREDTRLAQGASHTQDELRSAERALAGMMDKVSVLSFSLSFGGQFSLNFFPFQS